MKKPLIVGNWKAYVQSLKEAKKLFKDIEKGLPRELGATVVVCPPTPFLHTLAGSYRGERVAFGTQNIFFEGDAHTGEVTGSMLRSIGAEYVIVGHAERRSLGEDNALVAKKVGAALDHGLTPIVCVGERSRDKDGNYFHELEQGVLESLALVEEKSLKKVIIAYEPVWAIGAPLPPAGRTVRESLIFIRKTLAEKFDRRVALSTRIIYGGAVNEEAARTLLDESEADGFLLGRASVNADAFTAIVRSLTA